MYRKITTSPDGNKKLLPYLIIFILLTTVTQSITDLSLVNCPSYYLKSTPQ